MSPLPSPSAFAPLAEPFPAPDMAAWVELARKTLKGAEPQTLERRTPDGLIIRPLYTGEDALCGLAPRTVAWDIRARVAAGPGANADALEALDAGAASLLVEAFDGGVDLSAALEGVLTDLAPVALEAGFAGVSAANALDEAAKASPAAPLAFHLDPLGTFARTGFSPGPLSAHLESVGDLAARLRQTYPRASFVLASGGVAHEAGASPSDEIAFAAAAAVAYLRALERAGVGPSEAAPLFVFGLAADAEPLATIPKLRAGRRVFERILAAAGAAPQAKIEARSSRRMLTRADAWTNLIRLTSASFGAAVGGADAIVLDTFDAAAPQTPSPLAIRQTRNIQLVLAEESGLRGLPDPASGAYALEALSEDLARAAWVRFQTIEAAGGLVAALQSGLIATRLAEARAALRAELAAGERRIVGVTHFEGEQPPPAPPPRPQPALPQAARLAGPDDHCEPLEPIRLEDLV
ncbi:MAG TPA: methylmalonyl-CoA mutase family protein [Caulobacteraceae bacterium]|jgi:methylmalonyl-CoA mutase|nr:methylmalonyl-CoA mutase family protein [Caulobacteraceae bacterium]